MATEAPKPDTLLVSTIYGPQEMPCTLRLGVWAVTEAVVDVDDVGYVVTHAPTGHKAPHGPPVSRARAEDLCRRLYAQDPGFAAEHAFGCDPDTIPKAPGLRAVTDEWIALSTEEEP